MIAERRATGRDHGDLLSMLLAAQDDEGGTGGLSDVQVRDEAMTLILAGHETTANALTWTWYLLSQHRRGRGATARRDRSRARRAVCRRSPTWRDCRWSSGSSPRRCGCIRRRGWSAAAPSTSTRSPTIVVPAAAMIFMSPYVMHRDARFFPDAGALRSRSLDAGDAGRRCRSSPTSRSAVARGNASASSSR